MAVPSSRETDGDVPLVVYLARRWHGPRHVADFLESYRTMPELMPHRLLIIWKGFSRWTLPLNVNREPTMQWLKRRAEWLHDFGRSEVPLRLRLRAIQESVWNWFDLSKYPPLLVGIDSLAYHVGETGFDIGPYVEVFRRFHYPYYLFLNSSSRLLSPGWLTKLMEALRGAPRAGIVGATGSWERGKGETFPNPHVRTTGFLLSEEVFSKIQTWPMKCKLDTELFEHGPNGLTRQVTRLGLQPYVVGRNGKWYDIQDWRLSGTFRSDAADNLLIEDSQTRRFASASADLRASLASLSWGTADSPYQESTTDPEI